jgi:uncharacterized protein
MKKLTVLLLALMPLPALAASFDCDIAATKMEQMICSDAELSRADEELAAAYARALKTASDPEAVKKQQREWLDDTENHCDSVACLKSAYSRRVKELDSSGSQPARNAMESGRGR